MRRTQTSRSAPLSAPVSARPCARRYGGRLDHELSNIHLMRAAKDAGLFMEIYDAKNRIFLLTPDDEEHSVFRKTDLRKIRLLSAAHGERSSESRWMDLSIRCIIRTSRS